MKYMQNKEDIAKFKEIKKRLLSKNKKIILFIFLLLNTFGFVFNLLFYSIFVSFILTTIIIRRSYISDGEYYSIEGSNDNMGHHKCIFCGGKGIYRSTIYQTNVVQCKCSKCRTHLFNEY